MSDPHAESQRARAEEVVDLRLFADALWRGKWLILLASMIGAALGIHDLRSAVPQYAASMVVLPGRTATATVGQSSRLAQIGQIFGVETPGSANAATFDRLILLLSSPTFAERLNKKYGLIKVLFGAQWNEQENTWIRPVGARFVWTQRIREFLHRSTWSPPTEQTLAQYLGDSIKVEETRTGFQRLTYSHPERDRALEILTMVFREADSLVREQDRAAVDQNTAYLAEQLDEATSIDVRSALISLLISEEQKRMLLEVGAAYSGRIVDPPYASSKPTLATAIATLGPPMGIGFAASALLVLLIAVFRRESR